MCVITEFYTVGGENQDKLVMVPIFTELLINYLYCTALVDLNCQHYV